MTDKISKTNKKILTSIILLLIIILGSIGIYKKIIEPKMYDKSIISGQQYLEEEDYNNSIDNFEKAIKIDSNSIEARWGLASCYMKINKIDKAVEYLKQIQSIDVYNEQLTIKIVDMIRFVDEKAANEFIQNFIDTVGIDNISDDFRTSILESTNKNELSENLKMAISLNEKSTEGNLEGQYEVGSKDKLLDVINEAKLIKNNYLANQDEIDSMCRKLNEAINSFENGKVKAMPDGIGNKYIKRLLAIQSEVDLACNNLDLSNVELGDVIWESLSKYESVMNDIYSDLNTYLPSEKKSQLSSEKQKYQNEIAQAQAEFDQAISESFGTWGVTGEPDALATVVRKHCYYLINKYME